MWKVIQDQNIQDISLNCDICGKNVKNGHNLGDHFYLEHVTYFDSNCGRCAKIFQHLHNFRLHNKNSHQIDSLNMQMMCIYLWKQEQIKGTRGMEAQVFIVQASIRNKLFLNLTNFVHKKLLKPLWMLEYYGRQVTFLKTN